MTSEKIVAILCGTWIGGCILAAAVPNDYGWYALGVAVWLTTAVYGWLYRRPRRRD